MGGGKTTSAEYLHSLFHNIPIDIIKRVAVRGNPQLTQEKIIGRPDYGKMHQGQEEVVWQNFVLMPQKIVDEFNRIPETNQAMLLDGMDRGEWGYLNKHISTGQQPFFATCNYEDRGNNTLIPPILDRFDVATESKFPGVANAMSIGYDYHNEKDNILKDSETSKEILNLLDSKKSYNEIRKGLKEISNNFKEKLEDLTENLTIAYGTRTLKKFCPDFYKQANNCISKGGGITELEERITMDSNQQEVSYID